MEKSSMYTLIGILLLGNHKEFYTNLFMYELNVDMDEAEEMYDFYMENDVNIFNFLEHYENRAN